MRPTVEPYQIDQAFNKGDNQTGLTLLRQYTHENVGDAGSWHRLSVVEEQIGEWALAGKAHATCIQTSPNNPIAYLYAGYWLENSDLIQVAAAAYSIAYDLDPNTLFSHKRAASAEQTKVRSKAAVTLLSKVLKDQQYTNGHGRIKHALWPQTHFGAIDYGSDLFAPELFFIPQIRQEKFYDGAEFSWANSLCAHTHSIRAELNSALDDSNSKGHIRPYLPDDFSGNQKLRSLAGSSNWSAIDLYRNGALDKGNASNFPNTLKALESVPTYGLGRSPFEVFFSLLKPGQSIAEHYGQSNHSLTVHLGLEIPDNGYLEVAQEQKSWNTGEILIFDDSYLHSAHNTSDYERVVFIFSIWHPDLTDDERESVQNSFSTRQQWMDARVTTVQRALSNLL